MKMMKPFLILAFALLSMQAQAKKLYYPLEVIAGMADLIVVGEISGSKSASYTFKVQETVKGSNVTSITVQNFKEWTCDQRAKSVQKGQKLFLFLHKKGGEYEIINGSSGELFIIDDKVHGLTGLIYDPKPVNLNEFKTAIQNFTQCYALKGDYEHFGKSKFKRLKSESDIAALKSANAFSSKLFDKVKEYEVTD